MRKVNTAAPVNIAYGKIRRVINSCESRYHYLAARRMVTTFHNYYVHTYTGLPYEMHWELESLLSLKAELPYKI